MEDFIKPFGEEAHQSIVWMNQICEEIGNREYKYQFLREDIFEDMLLNDYQQGMQVYWMEMLLRSHWAASTSLFRNQRWIEGVYAGIKMNNYMLFSSCLRSLLESAGDTNDIIPQCAVAFADHYKDIYISLEGKAPHLFLSEELENKLIHYAYAKKQSNAQGVPASHVNQTAREYLNKISNTRELKRFHSCYSELCEVTHPAKASVFAFIDEDNKTLKLNNNKDADLIKEFCGKYSLELSYLYYLAVNPSLVLLKTLNCFSLEFVCTEIIDTMNLDSIPTWKSIISKIKEQKKLLIVE
ncbi:hypothetical protein TU49_10985 [Bacillus cereus]|nr:hypothetical protein TU49_10985 [Bacillus cereus]